MPSENRMMMDKALKKVVIPLLRNQGFKGSFPHFRRKNNNNIDLLTFQFNKWGGSFVVEFAVSPLDGITMHWGEHISPNKITAHHINKRYRLGRKSEGEDGIWFDFEKAKSEDEYNQVAMRVLNLLNTSYSSWISNLFN